MTVLELDMTTEPVIIRRERIMSISAADAFLRGKQLRKNTSVRLLEKNRVLISYQVRRCPFCGKETPDYETNRPIDEKTGHALRELLSPQLSLFPGQTEVTLQKPREEPEAGPCPKCFSNGSRQGINGHISITEENGRITLVLESDGIAHMMVLDTEDGSVSTMGDPQLFRQALTCYPVIRRRIRNVLRTYGPFPFTQDDITPETMTMAVRWIGYPASFYHGIPFDRGTLILSDRFASIGRDLHREADIGKVYTQYGLPGEKSIKKQILARPWLLFYYRELKQLHEVIRTPEFFVSLLKMEPVSELARFLQKLQKYPKIILYIQALKTCLGEKQCTLRILDTVTGFCGYAALYLCMDEEGQREEEKQWKGKNWRDPFLVGDFAISLPCNYPLAEVSENMVAGEIKKLSARQKVGPYIFEVLCSENTRIQAGRDLNNCLKENCTFQTVIGIRSRGKYVGAVELYDQKIVQARAYDNKDIVKDAVTPSQLRLKAAYLQWVTGNELQTRSMER